MEGGTCEDVACWASLEGMPTEILARTLGMSSAASVVAMGAVCRRFSEAASCPTLWNSLYRRDFGCDAPPDEHRDFATYGKDVRWLYVVAATGLACPRRDPKTGRLCARVPFSATAAGLRSGEFCLVADPKTGQVALQLDGYGARVDSENGVREGMWRAGTFVGPGRFYNSKEKKDTWCEAFDESEAPHGHGVEHRGGLKYVGEFSHGSRCGWGRLTDSDGESLAGEWTNGAIDGRVLRIAAGSSFAGQRRAGVDVSGIKRTRDGVSENHRGEWAVSRKASWIERGIVRKDSESKTVRTLGHTQWWHRGGFERIQVGGSGGSGGVSYTLVRHNMALVLLSIADDCPDATLVGRRRFFPGDTVDAHGKDAAPDALVSAFVRHLESPECAIVKASVRLLLNALGRTDVGAKKELVPTCAGDVEPVGGLLLPFGRALLLAENTDPVVRCFLKGTLVPAAQCHVVASGRAYHMDALRLWTAQRHHGTTDPETGQNLGDPLVTVPWRSWMANLEPSLIAWAMDRTRHLPSPAAGGNTDRHIVYEDALRLMVSGVTQTTVLCTATRAVLADILVAGVDVARSRDAPIVRGFDALTMHCVEFRHPQWDPRGPWRLGPPKEGAPDDPTMSDYERPDAGPLDYFDSHGIVRVALTSPSFVGARLDAVFFFKQTLRQASFAGAWLTDCAFVDCAFDRCVFAEATLVRCAFFGCALSDKGEDHSGTPIDTDQALERIHKTSML